MPGLLLTAIQHNKLLSRFSRTKYVARPQPRGGTTQLGAHTHTHTHTHSHTHTHTLTHSHTHTLMHTHSHTHAHSHTRSHTLTHTHTHTLTHTHSRTHTQATKSSLQFANALPPSLATKRSFRQLQRKVKRAVDEARESWIAKVAADGEAAVKDGKTRWESIRKLQRAFSGRKSVRPSAVKKLNGELAEGEAEVLQRWQQHFATLLNVQSSVDEEVLDAMPIHAQFCECVCECVCACVCVSVCE